MRRLAGSPTRQPRWGALAWLSAGATAFCLLSIFNCGGYRYGAADQAFYIPAILQHLDPSLFPHDRSLFSAQDRLSLFNRAVAPVMAASGVSLPVLFLLAYVAGLLLLFGGGIRIGRIWYQSWWTVAALALVLTLRHRLTQTGVNTLEAYLHPRMLAFGVGLWSISSFLKGNDRRALALVALAGALHPTTAIWFGVWVWVGVIVSKRSDPRHLPVLLGATLLVAAAGLWAIWRGPLSGGPPMLVRMDPEWASVLAGKDYVFPSDWGPSFWLVNVGYLAVILPVYRYRLQHQRTLAREDGLVAGACALVVLFLLSWPLASARIAVVIQLQVSRVFWMLDFLAALYLVWLGVEGRTLNVELRTQNVEVRTGNVRRWVVATIAAIAVVRGGYVMWIEHADAPIVRMNLAPGDWTDVMGWVARTPKGVHILTDPGHVYKYGSSVRVAGQRDVLLEEVTDTAMGLYARESAMRVLQRIRDLQNFDELTVERAGELAAKYDLDYLVIDRALSLPVAYRNDRFWVYELASSKF